MTDPVALAEGELTIVDVPNVPWKKARRGGPEGITAKPRYDGTTASFAAHQQAHYLTGPDFHERP